MNATISKSKIPNGLIIDLVIANRCQSAPMSLFELIDSTFVMCPSPRFQVENVPDPQAFSVPDSRERAVQEQGDLIRVDHAQLAERPRAAHSLPQISRARPD